MEIEQAYQYLYSITLVALGAALLLALLRAITARSNVQRIMSINLIGTIVILLVCLLTLTLQKQYVVDVAIIYVILSFAAVLILTRVYIDRYNRRKEERHDHRMD